jgi:malonyl CoA-acyl carrier protein transacylase
MGWELYQTEPVFRDTMDHCFDILMPLLGYDIKEILYPGGATRTPGHQDKTNPIHSLLEGDTPGGRDLSQPATSQPHLQPDINRFDIAQLVVFILQYALAQLLSKWGIKPRAMIGYSFGEYTAACLSGVFSLEDALKLIAARGQLIARIIGGSMMSVPLPLDQLKPLINNDLSIAIDNGPSCIVAGPDEAIDLFDKQLKAKRFLGMKLSHSQAVHSKMMEPILKEFENHVRQVQLDRPQIPFISNVTGQWITVREAADPAYWTRHLREMVCFAAGIEELKKESNPLFIEIGPGRDLKALLTRYKEEESTFRVVNLIRPQQQEGPADRYFLDKIGRLWLYGVDIDWQEFYFQETRRRIPLPTYPFDRQRYWFEGNPFRDRMVLRQTIPPRKADIADWFYIPQWKRSALPVDIEPDVSREQACWLLFVNESRLAAQLDKRLKDDNQEVIIVRKGSTFEALNQYEYTINPTQNNDYNHLFAELLKSKKVPRYIAHLWGVTGKEKLKNNVTITFEDIDRSQDLGLYSLLNIAQAIGNNSIEQDICLGVITDNMQPVTGEEELCPEKATILGPIKVIPLEYPNIKCLSIDIINAGSNKLKRDFIFDNLTREFSVDFNDYRVVAYRGTYRWLESYEALRLNHRMADSKKSLLKEKGVYMVTGGFGGMGFTLAEYLAHNFNSRLILVDILDTDLKEGHEQWLKSETRKKDIHAKMQKITEWENQGVEIQVYNADVSDYHRMKDVITKSEERFGKINGVIHTAGLIDYSGIIQRRTRQMTETLLDAKVRGTLVLDSLLKEHQLDFMVLFSSIGNLFHKLKFGQVAYNAGHEFMDVFAYYKQKQGTCMISIDWNDWTEVGMAVRAQQERSNPNTPANPDITQDFLSISPSQGIDAFKRIIANDFCRVIVFSRDLAPVFELMNQSLEEQEDIVDALGNRESPGRLHDRPELDTEYVAPGNEMEHALADIWQNFFAIKQVGIQDDFFELGGNSLLATTMVSRINQQLGIRIPLAEVYNRPTIKQLAEYMGSKAMEKFKGVHEKLVLFQKGSENADNFFFIHTGYAEVDVYFELSSRLTSDFTYWGVQADTITNYAPINLTFEEIAANNIKKIRTVQPHGPYYISGWCLGGKFAFEIVRQLEQMNEEVKLFVSIDSPAPQKFPSVETYTLEAEIKKLSAEGIPEDEIRKRIGDITEIHQLWPIIVDYLEETNFDINILRQMVHPTMIDAFPNFYELSVRELIFFLNTTRTYLRAEWNYHPVGKINAMTYSFEAIESNVNTYDIKWRDFCLKLKIFEIPGDHFSIFRTPDVTTFAEALDKALEELK